MNADISFVVSPLSNSESVVILSFSGQLDEMSCDDIFERLKDFLKKKSDERFFIFHLKDLEYINSKSIGYMTDIYRKISSRGGKLVLAEVPENVLDILDLIGITRVIEIADSLESAKVALLESE